MTRLHRVAIVLAIAAGSAHAQPGADQLPPQEAPAAGAPGPVEPSQATAAWNPDALIEQIAANVPALEAVAKGAFRRARRSISIGPTVGVYGAALPSPGELDYAITFGVGVELFKIPLLPTLDNLKAIVKERAKAKLKQVAIDRLKGKQPGELEQLAREVWEEAVKEVLGLENIRPKTMERPRFTAAIEGNRLLSSETWATRLRLGVGVWKLTVAGSIGAGFTEPDTGVLIGIEVVAHFLMSKNPRASVIDVFLRGDLEVRNRGTANTDSVVLGVRYLLDII
jgi:hypothetical protein